MKKARFVEVEVAGVVECVCDDVVFARTQYAGINGAIIRPTKERKTLGSVRHGIKALRYENGRWWSV